MASSNAFVTTHDVDACACFHCAVVNVRTGRTGRWGHAWQVCGCDQCAILREVYERGELARKVEDLVSKVTKLEHPDAK
jgi:hypothetical protein